MIMYGLVFVKFVSITNDSEKFVSGMNDTLRLYWNDFALKILELCVYDYFWVCF